MLAWACLRSLAKRVKLSDTATVSSASLLPVEITSSTGSGAWHNCCTPCSTNMRSISSQPAQRSDTSAISGGNACRRRWASTRMNATERSATSIRVLSQYRRTATWPSTLACIEEADAIAVPRLTDKEPVLDVVLLGHMLSPTGEPPEMSMTCQLFRAAMSAICPNSNGR